ncbi:type-2 proteins geranylgeranyltransferase subunit beta [Protomyces lactucae-debilis]|uniref:Geranylgeranyl transferase type-2 subunit beta n=1 Tax=Protomyces lactucae-debilis TaxID=2754530 RepID=A0A1Y2FC22_PROLT|nr:type-2 proteins geranylgeranyltransferase subunit beta [Protomyces lactucae-debilis]ORY80876.1 type-2 proteins geranylgeranyltransferase subunit beta [Protomyces lactucae-debilis]
MLDGSILRKKHISFIRRLYRLDPNCLEALITQYIRINGIYWALIAAHLLGRPNLLPRDEIIKEILACRQPDGGFGSAPGHDSHVVCTLHAVQILAMQGALHLVDAEHTGDYISKLQLPSGAIQGDVWGEVDMRINYAATQCLVLLGKLDKLNREALAAYVLQCRNFDGGFGMVPGAESHASHAFTSLGTLSLLGKLESIDQNRTAWWLSLRQLKNGGLNGRPEKLEDVCYSWWVLSALAMLDRVDWIDKQKLRAFILSTQDEQIGGMSDRPGDVPDINHTCFGLTGLSLLGYDGLEAIDPRFCMPVSVIRQMGL